jgi:DNA invertase Pin-like site-specific DNA recombinase
MVTGNVKVRSTHLKRIACLYIRQSTMKQVYENSESTKRQYDLKQKAISIGWSEDRVLVIDSDLGLSGANSKREGFQEVVTKVSMGEVGVVIGIEVSRFSRSSSNWGRLLEICAITDTLIMDEDGIYDINDFNDRILLGLKGTMSEAELHFLRSRLRGGLLNKAKRGELKKPLPIGYVYDDNDRIIFDPDIQVQQSIKLFFDTFRQVGSAWGTVKRFNRQGFKFPLRVHRGIKKGDLEWVQLTNGRTLHLLHNPAYAGIYAYGEHQLQKTPKGIKNILAAREDWHVCIKNSHKGYISIEEFENNLKILKQNLHPRSEEGRKSPVREGAALLQGVVVCGKCGNRMTIRYGSNKKDLIPIYNCQRRCIEYGEKVCQSIKGDLIDKLVGDILIEKVTPLSMEAALEVQKELENRKDEELKYFKQQLVRAEYEMELARKRYLRVDPDNRLVAAQLESDWNEKLRNFENVRNEYQIKEKDIGKIDDNNFRNEILSISKKFPELWNNKNVSNKDRKRMIRYLIEDVTLLKKDKKTDVKIRFRGGTFELLEIDNPLPIDQLWKTSSEVIDRIDVLTDKYIPLEIANILNKENIKSRHGMKFSATIVRRLIKRHKIKNRYARLKDKGLLTLNEFAAKYGISRIKVSRMRNAGELKFEKCDKQRNLYYDIQNVTKCSKEVQYEL